MKIYKREIKLEAQKLANPGDRYDEWYAIDVNTTTDWLDEDKENGQCILMEADND